MPEEMSVLLLSNLKTCNLFAINTGKFSFLKTMIFCKLKYLKGLNYMKYSSLILP